MAKLSVALLKGRIDVSVVLDELNAALAEECAMRRYQEIAELTEGKDFLTCDLAKKILAVEADHEQDVQDYLDDMETGRKYFQSK